ncbi:MAG: carbon-nitrogen hydrolase family protein [Candidatus Heimdallarchaeota archaeon]|nr:carbon-nitrogen hydrolase family protein [Candidatus Heimdallarchaeota archaeon]
MSLMRVTITQFDSNKNNLEESWFSLKTYLSNQPTDFLLLPEMPFYDWICDYPDFNQSKWTESEESHNRYLERLGELGVSIIAGTRPLTENGKRFNVAFIWDKINLLQEVHKKVYLPNEPGYWEANWYDPGPVEFTAFHQNGFNIGFLICTELWFMQHARTYSKMGIDILLNPRATPATTTSKWLAGGQTASVISGAYSLSSNHVGHAPISRDELGGVGWLSDPEGKLLAQTSRETPYVTIKIDINLSKKAKSTYPRYVVDEFKQ